LWSNVHGWPSLSHIDEFGIFYARAVRFICPVIGFALFLILSRHNTGWNIWKPMMIASLLLTPLQMLALNPLSLLGLGTAVAESARTLVVVLLMAWSIGAFGTTTPQHQSPEPVKASRVQS
jgi:hypothetical protein